MTLPGADVQIIDAAPPAAVLNDTGTAFVTGLADRGPTSGQVALADACHSLNEWIGKYGALQSYNGNEYATVEAFFAEGGTRLFFSRQAGPAAVIASAAVPASSSKFTAKAKGPGSYANTFKVGVAGSVITVKDGTTILEVSPTLADTAAAQAWAGTTSRYIDIVPLASGALTDSADVSLAGGADDRTSITDTQRQAALDRLGKDLGPGQVMMPGDTRTAAHAMLATHANANNRFALCDAPDSATVATVAAAGTAIRSLGRDLARHAQPLEPWLTAPGVNGGAQRTIPPCGVHAGLCARVDAGGNPNRAVAGRRAVSRFAIATKYSRVDSERSTLADAGVTEYRVIDSLVQPYDDVTPVDATADPEWVGASGNRFVMRVVADALAIAQAHMFATVDGPVELSAFNGDLKAMLNNWFAQNALYGDTPADAFRVETGPSVNTTDTIAARQLKAAIALKVAPTARQVLVTITNTPLGATL